MTLVQLFMIHRYRAGSLHYLTPTQDNQSQTERTQDLGIFTVARTEIGQISVTDVDRERVSELVRPNGGEARGADSEADATTGIASGPRLGLDGRVDATAQSRPTGDAVLCALPRGRAPFASAPFWFLTSVRRFDRSYVRLSI